MPDCRACGKVCADYKELAVHIAGSRKGHRRGKRWAAKFLLLKGKRDKPEYDRTPLTDEQKENRQSTKRVLSGDQRNALCICPKCQQGHRQVLPVEYVESPTAWRINGVLAIRCVAHGG